MLPIDGHHFLTEEGVSSARRVLCMIGMEHPEIDYLPMLPDLGIIPSIIYILTYI